MGRHHLTKIKGYLRLHWRRVGACGLVAVLLMLLGLQLVFPWDNLPLYSSVDGVAVGGQSKNDVTKQLDADYQKLTVKLYFGESPKPYRQPTTTDIGVTVSTKPQVESMAYPLWLRLIPSSLWWAHMAITPAAPSYSHDNNKAAAYMQKELGQSCDVKAVNATVEYKDKKLQVIPAIDGGTCNPDDVQKMLTAATPRLNAHDIHIAMTEHPTKLHDGVAQDFADKLADQTKNGVTITAGSQTVKASQNDVLSWLDFTAPDTGIVATVNSQKANDFFTKQLAPKVNVAAGTSKVTTLDFTEVSRVDGPSGQTLDADATAASLTAWLADSNKQPEAKTKTVAPAITYTRTYTPTDTGITALITQFAQGHPGTFGVSYAELDGKHRHAGYNDTKIFQTASTYKLFVAYSTLKRIESGQWHWSDLITGGKDATQCFNDMIRLSDNACAEAFLTKIGFSAITNEIHAVGLNDSSFMTSYIQTTPANLATYLGALQSGQLLNPTSTSTLLSAMKQNVYRQGIPAGTGGTVADKVGFLNPGSIQGVAGTVNLLHDAAIVYDPSGTYVLVVMTGNSSWSTIADLTKQIESLRNQG